MVKTRYVAGFMFDSTGSEVVLIQKNRPDWQKGKLNGIGGHVEQGEIYLDAMVREFEEETGVKTEVEDWGVFARLSGPEFELIFFRSFSKKVYDVQPATDEPVFVIELDDLKNWQMISNLRWLIPLALDREVKIERVEVKYA